MLATKLLLKYSCMFSAPLQINFLFLFSHYTVKVKLSGSNCCNYLESCIKGEGNRHYRDASAVPGSGG